MLPKNKAEGEEFPPQISTIEIITPDIAKTYLATMDQPNGIPVYQRHLSKNRVYELAKDIKAGGWRLTHQSIAFNLDGVLIDGQHRMNAVIMANTPIQSWVHRNVPQKAMACIDIGAKRSVCDSLNAQGLKFNDHEISILRAALGINPNPSKMTNELTGIEKIRFSRDEIMKLAIILKDGLEFSLKTFGSKTSYGGMLYAPFRAVVFRAYYNTVDRDRLTEFLEALYLGCLEQPSNVHDANSAAYALREYHHKMKINRTNIGTMARARGYCMAQSALISFLARKRVKNLLPKYGQRFPVDLLDGDMQLDFPVDPLAA